MDAANPAKDIRHELFVTDGNASFRWAMSDSGVTLSRNGLFWAIGGIPLTRDYSDIFSIRLQRASAGTGANVGICQIRFRDGTVLNIHGGSAHGIADDAQAPLYTALVHDLHRRLADRDDSKGIVFNAGLSERRYTILTIAVMASGILFGVLPLILLIMMRDLQTLVLFAGATGLLWSFYKLWDKNRPRAYSPSAVPEELLS
jgi:hypothetical protein